LSQQKEYAKKFLLDVIGQGNYDVLDEILHEEYMAPQHQTSKDRDWSAQVSFTMMYTRAPESKDTTEFEPGRDAAKARMKGIRASGLIPKRKIKLHSLIEENDKVVVAYSITFTHNESYWGIDPTHKEISYNGVYIFTFLDEKIVKLVLLPDTHQLLTQLGDIVLSSGSERQIQQYVAMLKQQNLLPTGKTELKNTGI